MIHSAPSSTDSAPDAHAASVCIVGIPAQFRIDLRDKRAELQLFRELARVEIANRTRLNFRWINLRVVDRLFAGLDDDVPDRFPFLLQVALKIRASAAENVNFVHISDLIYPIFSYCHPERSEGPRLLVEVS